MVQIGVGQSLAGLAARPSSTELYVAYDDPQGLKAQRWPEQQ